MIAELNSKASRAPVLEMPSELEAHCYLYFRRDGLTQQEIADRLKISQGSVARAIARLEQKLEALKSSGRFDPEEIDLVLERLTNRAAHGRKLI